MNIENRGNLERFIEAQQKSYQTALAEIKQGVKRSHWMWYVFPQLRDLGLSETAKFYGIKDKHEAEAYLAHPVLKSRLVEISAALLQLDTDDAHSILGSPDDMKLRSSMTLFAALSDTDPVFQLVLDKYYGGQTDTKTLDIIG